jgi:hypothetical protein
MLKFFNGEERQNILILNYNTVILHSVGFLTYMKNILNFDNPLSKYEGTEFVVNVLQLTEKNTAKIIDPSIDDEFYFNFINTKFQEVTDQSPLGSMQYYLNILQSQNFINKVHIASPVNINMKQIFVDVIEPTFDIFNIDTIVNYINANRITCLFLHDIEMMKKIIEHPKMDSEQFTYLLSKIGYNYREVDDAAYFRLPEIMDLKDQKRFLIGVVNLLSDDEKENLLI